MARLVIPKSAVSWKGTKHNKWHLLRVYKGPLDSGPMDMSVCGYIMEPMVRRAISQIRASDLCRKCLGAMKARD